jgi:hypothetical protein
VCSMGLSPAFFPDKNVFNVGIAMMSENMYIIYVLLKCVFSLQSWQNIQKKDQDQGDQST